MSGDSVSAVDLRLALNSDPMLRHIFQRRRAADADQSRRLDEMAVGLLERRSTCRRSAASRMSAGLRKLAWPRFRDDQGRYRQCSVEAVAKFAHVARRWVRERSCSRQCAEAADARIRACGVVQEAIEQPKDVLRPLPERRDVDRACRAGSRGPRGSRMASFSVQCADLRRIASHYFGGRKLVSPVGTRCPNARTKRIRAKCRHLGQIDRKRSSDRICL